MTKRIEIGRFEDFQEFRDAVARLDELRAQEQQLQERAKVIQTKIVNVGVSGLTRIKNAALKLISRAVPEPEENVEQLREELNAISSQLPVVSLAITLQKEELAKLKSALSSRLCEGLVGPYKERLLSAGRKYLEAVESFQDLEDFRGELRDRGISFSARIEAFHLPGAGNLGEHSSTANLFLRSIQEYAGAPVEGWVDPLVARQPKPGPKRRVRLLGTMSGPAGVNFRGDVVATEYADFLIESKQAEPLGIGAMRAKLEAIPTT